MAINRKPRVKEQMGWRSDASVTAAVKDGTITAPVKLGPRAVGWPEEEIIILSQAKIAGANTEQLRELVARLHSKRPKLDALMGELQ